MTPEPTPPFDVHALALEARAIASNALAKANEAIDRCERAEAAVAGHAHALTRCTNEVLEMKRRNSEDHAETMAAIEGAKISDKKQAGEIRTLQSKLTALDLIKLAVAGGGSSALVAIVLGVLALLSGRPLPPQPAPLPAPTHVTPGATP